MLRIAQLMLSKRKKNRYKSFLILHYRLLVLKNHEICGFVYLLEMYSDSFQIVCLCCLVTVNHHIYSGISLHDFGCSYLTESF